MFPSYRKGFNSSHDGLLSWFHQELWAKWDRVTSLIISDNRWRQQCYLINKCLPLPVSTFVNRNFTSTTPYFFGIICRKPHTHTRTWLIGYQAVGDLMWPCYHRSEVLSSSDQADSCRRHGSCGWQGAGKVQSDPCSIFAISPLKRSICWFYREWFSELLQK